MHDEPAWMKHPVASLLGGALGVGIAGGVFGYLLDRVGRGLLQRLPVPVPGGALLIGAGAVLGAVTGLVFGLRELRERARVAHMGDAAAALGLAYEPSATRADLGVVESSHFPNWSGAGHRFHGDHRGLPVEVVDVTEVEESRNSEGETSTSTTLRTVVLLPGEGLPDFDLSPRRIRHRVLGALGVAGVVFDRAGAATPHQAEAVGRFARSWHLAASDLLASFAAGTAGSPGSEAAEESVRRLFTPRVMEALEPLVGLSARVRGGRLAVWRGEGHTPAGARAALLGDAIALCEALLSGRTASTPDPIIPAPPGVTPRTQARRLAGVGYGGMAGLFLGFFGGCGVFVSQVMGRDLPFGASTVLMPLLAFGGASLGALIGAVLGRLASPFMPLPRPAAPAAAGTTATGRVPGTLGGWEGAGMMLGFMLGGLVSIGLMAGFPHPSGPDGIRSGFRAPLLFAGPLLGMAGGAIAGSRFAARRAARRMRAADPEPDGTPSTESAR